jgi:leucyl aminopeptidase
MKPLKFSGNIFIVLGILLSLTTCKKEDADEFVNDLLIQSLINDIKADSLEADVIWLQNMGNRFTLTNNHRDVAEKLEKRFLQMGFADVFIDSFLVSKIYRSIYYEQWQYNVIAVLTGSEYPDSVCVIGGHYDDILSTGDPFTIVPGANDNASGVSAVMEIARVMKKKSFSPKSTIMFIAFGAEEIGLFGSKDFAANPNGFSQKIRFMLNSDMIAYEPATEPSAWYVNIMDYDNSHDLRYDAEQICARYTSLSYITNNTNNKYSDSYPFSTNGYKALFFFSYNVDPNYHTLNDLAANCNFEYCSEIVKLECALLASKN